jgi:hypothetical protein
MKYSRHIDHVLRRILEPFLVLGVTLFLSSATASAREKPDILFIAIDDMNDWTTLNPLHPGAVDRGDGMG